jgi:hypothetical protein
MENTKKLTLIDGIFSHVEAKEILLNLFTSKINFHSIKNWSSQERYGKDDEIAQKRIPALRSDIQKIQEILLDAKVNNKKLLVRSEVNIFLSDDL